MRYLVTIGQDTLELEVERSPGGDYRVVGPDGRELQVVPQATRAGLTSLLVGDQRVELQLSEAEARFRQERFSVKVESWQEHAASTAGASVEAHSRQLESSMSGRVVRVLCEVGSIVQPGTALIVIEAMKMQNELCAKSDGVVCAIHASVGQNVERGALLIEFE